MTRYLLDTNAWIEALRGNKKIEAKLAQLAPAQIILSPVVEGELVFGAFKGAHRKANIERLEAIGRQTARIAINESVAKIYGEIRAALESKGRSIGSNDYWIAAQAIAVGCVLVSANTGEFSRVAGLRLENWEQ
jgi:tRNA(fMet)-specific endonuclease VapC